MKRSAGLALKPGLRCPWRRIDMYAKKMYGRPNRCFLQQGIQ